MAAALYDDGRVRLDSAGILLRRYYFPLGTAKRIAYTRVCGFEVRPLSWLGGKGRIWGTTYPRFWFPLDIGRARRERAVLLDIGHYVRPVFTPDDADDVVEILRRHVR